MDIHQLSFPVSPLSRAVADLQTHLAAIEDLNGEKVFQVVRPGLFIPRQDYTPRVDEVPACFVWSDSKTLTSISRGMLITETAPFISLYMVWYDHGDDPGGVATQREDMVDYVISKLQEPDFDPPEQIWSWPPGELTITVDHTNAYRRVSDTIQLQPPWYSTRVDLPLWTHGVSNTLGDNEE